MNVVETFSLAAVSTQPPSLGSLGDVDCVITFKETHECRICFSDYTKQEVIYVCNQKHQFCKSCTIQYLEKVISDSHVENINCPQDLCSEHLDDKFIKEVLPEDIFLRYQYLLNMKIENRGKLFCPNVQCSKAYVPEKKKSNGYWTCECGTKICNKCGNNWHKGQTCKQGIRSELQAFSKEKKVKFCPQCKVMLYKDHGCNHMTCSLCQYQWCWLCEKKYSRNHELVCRRMTRPRPMQTGKITDIFRLIWYYLSNFLARLVIFLGIISSVGIVLAPIAIIIIIIVVAIKG